jgi:hypothetical protein
MSTKQPCSNSHSKSLDGKYFEAKGRAQSARLTAPLDHTSLAQLISNSFHSIPGEPEFKPYTGKAIPLGLCEHLEETGSREV